MSVDLEPCRGCKSTPETSTAFLPCTEKPVYVVECRVRGCTWKSLVMRKTAKGAANAWNRAMRAGTPHG